MRAIIYKYSLTDNQWCDNRTVEDFERELTFPKNHYFTQRQVAVSNKNRILLKGGVVEIGNFLYALSKPAIEEYIKEKI